MSYATIIPIEPPGKAMDFSEADSPEAFKRADESHASILDVLHDDKYAFSLFRTPAEGCLWELYQRTGGSLDWMGNPECWKPRAKNAPPFALLPANRPSRLQWRQANAARHPGGKGWDADDKVRGI